MKKLIWLIVILVVVGVIWKVGKNDNGGTSTSEPIKIGAIISETGVAAAFGEMSRLGIEMAVEEINDDGGMNGRMVEVVYEDDRTDPKAAVGLYQKLTSIDKVDAIIGSNFDFVTQPIFSLAKDGSTVVISPSNPRIAGAFDTNSMSFVMMSDFSKIVTELKPYLVSANYKKLGIVRFASNFGAEITKTLTAINSELGKPVMAEEIYNQIGDNDFRTTILKLKTAGVDLVFLDMVGPDPLTFVRQAKQLSYAPKMVTNMAVIDSINMSEGDKSLFDGMIVLNWSVTTEDFASKFKSIYNREPNNSVNRAYDAVYILAEAIAENSDKANIAKYLETTKFTTPNGPFSFTADHAAAETPAAIQIIKDGKFTSLVIN